MKEVAPGVFKRTRKDKLTPPDRTPPEKLKEGLIDVMCPNKQCFKRFQVHRDWVRFLPRVQCVACSKWLRPIDIDAELVDWRTEKKKEAKEYA